MVDDASYHLSCYTSTHLSIWHRYGDMRLKDNGVTTVTLWGHVTSSVTWPFDSRGSTFYGWSIVTMRLSGTVMEIWPFEVLPGRLFQEQRSVVGQSVGSQYYSDLILYHIISHIVTLRT